MQKIPAKEIATDREVFGASDLDQSLKEIKGQKFMDYVNVKDFGAVGDGVSDDSVAFQNALDTGNDIYVPSGTYLVSGVNWDQKNNIYGNHNRTVIKNNVDDTYIFITGIQNWNFKSINNLTLKGKDDTLTTNGFKFGNNDAFAGRVIFNNINFINFNKAVFKESGNIGNRINQCTFEKANYHWYAEDSTTEVTMHAGCDYFEGCHFSKAQKASIYYSNNTDGIGQITFNNCIQENNNGFCIFINDYLKNQISGITLNSHWMESNHSSSTVNINGNDYTPFDIYLNNINQFFVENTFVNNIKAINSTINLNKCRVDGANLERSFDLTNTRININNLIAFQSTDLIANNLLSFDTDNPYNCFLTKHKNKLTNGYEKENIFKKNFNGNSSITLSGSSSLSSTQVTDSLLFDYSAEYVLPVDYMGVISLPNMTSGKYAVYLTTVKIIEGDIKFRITDDVTVLNIQTEFKDQWVTLTGIGKSFSNYNNNFYISNEAVISSKFRINNIQIFEFDNKQKAVDFLNSDFIQS
jgi:hypothetical protein